MPTYINKSNYKSAKAVLDGTAEDLAVHFFQLPAALWEAYVKYITPAAIILYCWLWDYCNLCRATSDDHYGVEKDGRIFIRCAQAALGKALHLAENTVRVKLYELQIIGLIDLIYDGSEALPGEAALTKRNDSKIYFRHTHFDLINMNREKTCGGTEKNAG